MTVQKRIQTIRLIERLKNNPDLSKKIEVEWEIIDKKSHEEKSKKEVK